MKKSLTQFIIGVGVVSSGIIPFAAHADFIKDSSGTLELKNYYFNRDYREEASQSVRAEWAQGFLLGIKSGFTDGTVGFGLDAMGMLGLKLDSSPDKSGTGLLQRDSDKRASDSYSKLGVTAKARLAKSELRVGYLVPDLPTLQPNTSRLFPQSFSGTQLVSNDISNLKISLGQLDQAKDRDSTNYEDMKLTTISKVYKSTALSDQFRFAGGDYSLTPNTLLSYHYAELDSIYHQQYGGFKNSFGLGPGNLKTDVRYFKADKDGAGLAGDVDNRALSTRLTYQYGGHSIGGGFQRQFGTTPFTYLDGSISYLFTEYQFTNFTQTKERAWHARYDYNFADLGLPGLLFGIKYAKGDSAEVIGFNGEGREWERDVDISYVVQTGPFKGVSMRWRNALAKGNFYNDVNENRVLLGYTLALW
ncbi:OprD family porin [Pseudomonas sp. HN11]|uniref:OprD family porin n=1 Tax=Pseudomonas sp. HN11 TaxID=1344094 RepID=UPI001F253417|nr:OprD family porin [Pseudomonas sp. HN11]UII73807.1 OprD family porin [Pseudomonas sp. HN11]